MGMDDETSASTENGFTQVPLPSFEKTIAKRVKNLKKESMIFPAITEETLAQLLGEENLIAQDGEQKYYRLPDQEALKKFMDTIPASISGEFSQSRRWHKTNVKIPDQEGDSANKIVETLEALEKRLARMETLLRKDSGAI